MRELLFKPSLRLAAFLVVLAGISGVLEGNAYLGCAEGCRGAYCWGSTTGSKGCMETIYGCVLFYTQLCPP